ncbi:MAG: glycoside hydrolase domain-containing protein [Candidatus Aminicenantaceae bacterium]
MSKMKLPRIVCLLSLLSALLSAQDRPRYGTGTWDAAAYGNHRAVLHVTQEAEAVYARIPWLRRDQNPDQKGLVIVDAATQKPIKNWIRLEINREYGEIAFQPVSGAGDYFVYYLVNRMEGRSNYPTVTYPGPEEQADPGWRDRHRLGTDVSSEAIRSRLPAASVREIQSIDAFNSFSPMEVIATSGQKEALLERHRDADFLLFPEDRRYPVRMTADLPLRWIEAGAEGPLQGQAARGEYYVFQVAVYAFRLDLPDLEVSFSGLTARSGQSRMGPERFTCFNTGGTDWRGNSFTKKVPVPRGTVQSLWCGVQIPTEVEPGEYNGTVTVACGDLPSRVVKVRLEVTQDVLEDAGDGEPWRHSRLRWLNSRLALDDDPVAPYTPVEMRGRVLNCLGRSVSLNETGLPSRIRSYFTAEVTSIGADGRDILSGPIRLLVADERGEELAWEPVELLIERQGQGTVRWSGRSRAGPIQIECRARMEFDGFLDFEIRMRSDRDLPVSDIALEIPFRKDAARFMLGMGVKGGKRPPEFRWKWKTENNQDSAWLGDVNAGLQCSFRDERYSRPLNTNFYLRKPLVLPDSWWNGGQGGCDIIEPDAGTVLLRAYSGPREMKAGETQHYYFSLLITPFRPLNTRAQWSTRYYHRYEPVDRIAATGANTINVHHATDINPFINYPFLRPGQMKSYIDEAHQKGMRVKIYYTVRELSNRAPELFALRSLGNEIFFPGQGGGFSWLQEHLDPDYIAAWFVPELKDAAVINSGVSRWHNYYVEGLDWLVRNIGIDGLYIDDVAFDRTVMKRVRKVLDRSRPEALIDLHSANQFNVRDGFANSANLYMEHFPYIDRLWFGEYFDYDAPPDYWLMEVSGIPFGLMGEMLQGGGNPWRGMLYGMTARLPWAGDPRGIWKAWDEFGLKDASMVGYWSPNNPVRTDNPEVLATVYVRADRALISLASWAGKDVRVKLMIDWEALGLDPDRMVLTAPHIPDFQEAARFGPQDSIPVPAGRGWLLILALDID